MAAKSCRKIEVLIAADAILDVIADSKEPIGISEIAKATNLTNDSVFRQLGTMTDLRWVEKIGDGFTLGMKEATRWARKKSMLESERENINHKLTELS
jgi:DNA-binding IclR family transcriptional regulator